MSQTKNNVAADVIVNPNVNTINNWNATLFLPIFNTPNFVTYLSVGQGSVSQDIWSIA
jgi:hypothetical protein